MTNISPVLWGGPHAGTPVAVDGYTHRIVMPIPRRLALIREPVGPLGLSVQTVAYVPRKIAAGDQVWHLYVYEQWADHLTERIVTIINRLPWLWWWCP